MRLRLLLIFSMLVLPSPSFVEAQEDAGAKADRAEFESLHQQIRAQKDPRWESRALELSRQYKARQWRHKAKDAIEVHGVALMRGDDPGKGENRRRARAPTVATVKVTRKGCSVVLILSGRSSIEWRIETAEGVRIDKVMVYGRQRQIVRGVDVRKVQQIRGLFVQNRRLPLFDQLAATISPLVGGLDISTYLGSIDPGKKAIEVGPGDDRWRRQMLLAAMRALHWDATRGAREHKLRDLRHNVFEALVWTGNRARMLCDCTASGPIADTMRTAPRSAIAVAVDPDTGRRYFLDRTHLEEQDAAGKSLAKMPIPYWLGPRGWAAALAYDGRRRRLVLASMSGALAAFDLADREWRPIGQKTRQANGRARIFSRDGFLSAFTYDPLRDCFWALHSNGRTNVLRQLTPFGDERERVPLRLTARIQPGARNGVVLRAAGRYVILLTVNWAGRGRAIDNGYVLDPVRGTVVVKTKIRTVRRLEAPAQKDWPELWERMLGHDPYGAMRICARGRAPLVAYLKDRWDALPQPTEADIGRALVQLAAPEPVVRSRAYVVLSQAGAKLRTRLLTEIKLQESPEVRLGLRRLIEQFDTEPNVRARLLQVLAGSQAPGAASLRRELRTP